MKEARRRRLFSNAALYIVASWVTIQVADLAIEAGLIGWSLRDVFIGAFLGFPLALIVGWFYDVTRRGVVRTAPEGADENFDGSLRRIDYLFFAGLAVLWAGAIYVGHVPAQERNSIAILPFDNPGRDPDSAVFGFGLRTDLHTQLQSIRELTVIARESSDRIDGDMPLRDVGARLGAAFLMKGSVERVLERVRVNVILLEAETGDQSWAGSFDRELTAVDWFDIRNEISRVITERLRTELSPAERRRLDARPTEDLAALQDYFRGRQRLARRTTGALAEAVQYFEKAVDRDPGYALAYVGLADSVYLNMLYGGLSEEEELPRMEAAVGNALALDEQLGEAHATLAVLHRMRGRDQDAIAAFERAIELSPSYATARQWYGSTLVSAGRLDEGLAQKMKALELDPLSAIIHQSTGMTLARLGRFDNALMHYELAIEIDPDMPGPYERIAELQHTAFGRLDEAVVWQRKGVALDPGDPMGSVFLAMIYLDLGGPSQAESWLRRATELAPPGSPMGVVIMEPLYLYRGDEAEALAAARTSFDLFGHDATQTLTHLRNRDLRAGRVAEARARYEQGFPEMFREEAPTIDRDNLQIAIDVALVLIRNGERARADVLLERSLAVVRSDHRLGPQGYGIADVMILAMQGDAEGALKALGEAIDAGWRAGWWLDLKHDPSLDALRGMERYQAMVAGVETDMAGQLRRVDELESAGTLEPVPD